MRPSQTASGQAWLENFIETDVPTATVLLDSLRFASLSAMHGSLRARLELLVGRDALRGPILVLPERSLAAPELGLAPESRRSAVAYRDFHPGAPISATPGSDGFVGGLLRDFARPGRNASDADWIASDASLEQLRDRRCRSIVIVTDYIGSGERVIRLAESIGRHPTIRSWRSLHLLGMHVLAFAASSEALPRVHASQMIDSVQVVEAAPTFSTAAWTSEVHDSVVELCQRACRTARRWALGFRDSCGLFATQRGAPNNLPAIFWQTPARWQPLFPNRAIPSEFAAAVGDYRASEELSELADRVGQLRIGRNERLTHMRVTSRALLGALVLIGQRARTPASLAAELGTDLADTEGLLAGLRELGLIDDAGRITEAGRAELAAQKRGLRRTTAGLKGSDAPYYPLSLK